MDHRYLCERCLNRYEDGAECPSCAGEPLLDLADEEVVRYLAELDANERRAKLQRFTLFAALGALPVVVLAFWLLPDGALGWDAERRVEWALGSYVLLVLFADGLLIKTFPPRQRVPPGGFA